MHIFHMVGLFRSNIFLQLGKLSSTSLGEIENNLLRKHWTLFFICPFFQSFLCLCRLWRRLHTHNSALLSFSHPVPGTATQSWLSCRNTIFYGNSTVPQSSWVAYFGDSFCALLWSLLRKKNYRIR